MKGTLISSDYVKARDNSIRLIETNTDTVIYDDILDKIKHEIKVNAPKTPKSLVFNAFLPREIIETTIIEITADFIP